MGGGRGILVRWSTGTCPSLGVLTDLLVSFFDKMGGVVEKNGKMKGIKEIALFILQHILQNKVMAQETFDKFAEF